ncbi:unnamed protein product [Auanema sp. JU1783]|nr:unnamed protein product [Auanema sp. JU1783]
MLCDSLMLMMHFLYLGPSILLGNWFFEGEQNSSAVSLIGSYLLEFWFLQSLIQILLAITRLHVIYHPEKNYFTVNRILRAFFLLILLSLFSTAVFQLLFSCCRFIPDPRVFGYSSLNLTKNRINTSTYSIGLPYDLICSTICSISYVKVRGHISY